MTDTLMDQASEAKRTALGTLLIERGYLDQEQLDEALRRSAENGERLGEVIVKLGWASEDDLAKVLAEQWHLRYFERSAISFDGKALRRMSWEDASRLEALPIQENDQGEVAVNRQPVRVGRKEDPVLDRLGQVAGPGVRVADLGAADGQDVVQHVRGVLRDTQRV